MDPGIREPWYQRSTLYQIYPLSFADSNGDGFGDIPGIIRHLDYLNDGTAESLGVGAVWLSPVYASPMADWGYDVSDHKAIDPKFGTMDDFDRLVGEIHGRGMKLLMDYVPNHTSVEHSWFAESRRSRDSAKRDWYIWADPAPDGGPPNNWLAHFGGSAWEFDKASGQYYLHTFLKEQPDLNWRNQEVREGMLDVLAFWLDKGVDGFRTDAVYSLIKDEQLRDDPINPAYREGVSGPSERLLHVHSSGQKELFGVVGSFCDVLAEKKPGSYMLSEAYLSIPQMHEMYQACRRHAVHAPFNFNLMTLEWGAQIYRSFIDEYEASMGPDDWPNYVIGNHDRHRVVSRLGEDRARLLGMLQLTLRGMPVVYYGEELGLPDGEVGEKGARDVFGRDPIRTPMPWNSTNDAGFTTGTSWLPTDKEAQKLSVESQERRPDSMLHLYRHLIRLRNVCPALSAGDYRSVELENNEVYGYIRETALQRFLVVLNFGSKTADVELPGQVGIWIAGTHNVLGDGEPPAEGKVRLKAYEGRIYELIRGGQA